MMARAVPRMPAPTIKTSDSWWIIRRRVVGDKSVDVVMVRGGEEKVEVGGLAGDAEGLDIG